MPAELKKWDPWKTVDISPQEMELIKQRKAMAAERKSEFRRLVDNPYKTADNRVIVDSGLQRWYSALQTYGGKNFRPEVKNTSFFLGVFVLPTLFFSYKLYKSRAEREKRLRAGLVPMKERVNGIDNYFG